MRCLCFFLALCTFSAHAFLKKSMLPDFIDSIMKLECLIPTGLNEISRTIFLQKCLSKSPDGESLCSKGLGCFPMNSPWISTLRPLPTPYDPNDINVGMVYFSRKTPNGVNITLWPEISLENTDFDPKREKTIFATHGFASSGLSEWLTDLKDAILKKVDVNVFIVDWENGSKLMNYFQATANTRIVGAEIGRAANHLISTRALEKSKIYLIGHSLGAHTMSYAANHINNNSSKVGRITGLDPAQPCFELLDPLVKLDKSDADFVDIIHTNSRPTIPTLGLGIMEPIGHVDFYMNGGDGQPGCILNKYNNITSFSDLAKMSVEALKAIVGCSHGRSYQYFISSLKNTKCGFSGRWISSIEKLINIGTLGTASHIGDAIGKTVQPCSNQTCTIIGLETEYIPLKGYFSAQTSSDEPYCDASQEFNQLKQSLLQSFMNRTINRFST